MQGAKLDKRVVGAVQADKGLKNARSSREDDVCCKGVEGHRGKDLKCKTEGSVPSVLELGLEPVPPSRNIREEEDFILLRISDDASHVERHWRPTCTVKTMKLVISPTYVSACQAMKCLIAIDQDRVCLCVPDASDSTSLGHV